MNIKSAMLHDAGLQDKWLSTMNEMAAKELKAILKTLKSGDAKTAAEKYVELGGSPRANAVNRTINSFIKKNPDEDSSIFTDFRNAVKDVRVAQEPAPEEKKKQVYKKREITGKTKEGEEVVSGRSAKQQRGLEMKQLKGLASHVSKGEDELKILDTGTEEQKRKLAKNIYSDQRSSGDIRALEAWLSKGDKSQVEVSDLTGKRGAEEKKVSKSTIDRNYVASVMKRHITDKDRTVVDTMQLAQFNNLASGMVKTWKKDLADMKSYSNTGEKAEEVEELLRQSIKDGVENIKLVGSLALEKRQKADAASARLKEDMLRSVYNYEGEYFWENYIWSNIVRTFPKDMAEYGKENTMEMYMAIYGKETRPIFEYMLDNEEMLLEVAEVKGLLFEERYLTEIEVVDTLGKVVGAPTKVGFLKGLWNTIKGLAPGFFGNIQKFVAAGFSWAKNLVKSGISFIATNPILKVAVPAVLIAGGVAAGIKLINKLRNKAKKKRMTPEEEQALKNIVDKNRARMDRAKQKAGIKEKTYSSAQSKDGVFDAKKMD